MSDSKLVNRIPFEEIETFQVWTLPTLSNGRVIPSVKKPVPPPPIEEKKPEEKQPEPEIIEEILEPEYKPFTAEMLHEITLQAEEEGRERGFKEGFSRGYADGEKKGTLQGEQKAYKELKKALEEEKQRFQAIAEALLDPLKTQDAALENVVLDMAVRLAKHLLNCELQQDLSSFYRIVERAVAALPAGAKNIRIFVHPDDVQLCHNQFQQQGKTWQFFADNTLERGGCRVETEQSWLNYSIEQRLQTLLTESPILGDLDPSEQTPILDYAPEDVPQTVEALASMTDEPSLQVEDVPASTAVVDFATAVDPQVSVDMAVGMTPESMDASMSADPIAAPTSYADTSSDNTSSDASLSDTTLSEVHRE